MYKSTLTYKSTVPEQVSVMTADADGYQSFCVGTRDDTGWDFEVSGPRGVVATKRMSNLTSYEAADIANQLIVKHRHEFVADKTRNGQPFYEPQTHISVPDDVPLTHAGAVYTNHDGRTVSPQTVQKILSWRNPPKKR